MPGSPVSLTPAVVSFVSVLVLAIACQKEAPLPAVPDLAALEAEIRAADTEWLKAVQSKNAAGEAAIFANDGVAYRANRQPIVGQDAYRQFIEKDYADNPKGVVSWTTDKIELAKSGDLAYQTGTVYVSGMGPKGDVLDTSRFVTVWKKTDAGWRVAQDISISVRPVVKQ